MVRVLVVDDSAFMRNAIKSMLESDPDIKVAGMARDGMEAVEKVDELRPDIVTMDVEMPKMDGIEALRRIMSKTPVPVIMISSMTNEGARITLEALDIGAVDFIPKNLANMSVNILKLREILIGKIKYMASKGLPRRRRPQPVVSPAIAVVSAPAGRKMSIMAVGTSTGGPKALQEIIPQLPDRLPVPVLVAQHMPPSFTGPFAERLNQLSRIAVKEAEDGEPLLPGVVFVAPGWGHMRVKRKGMDAFIDIVGNGNEFLYRPSVDALFLSAAEFYPGRTLAVILTGMGNDGLRGAAEVKKTGGKVLAQDEDSSVVYGMPKAVVDAGLADRVLPLEMMAEGIINALSDK